jgi:hypothetical protein
LHRTAQKAHVENRKARPASHPLAERQGGGETGMKTEGVRKRAAEQGSAGEKASGVEAKLKQFLVRSTALQDASIPFHCVLAGEAAAVGFHHSALRVLSSPVL